jgi:hypothetical protein
MRQTQTKMEEPGSKAELDRKRLILSRLESVNSRLQEYGRLYGGRIAKAHLQLLSDRRDLLSKRRQLIALMSHQWLRGSLRSMADAASTRSEAALDIITSQLEVYNARWMALENEMNALKRRP